MAWQGSQQIFYGYYDYSLWVADPAHRTPSSIRFSQADVFNFPERKAQANVVRYIRDLATSKIKNSAITSLAHAPHTVSVLITYYAIPNIPKHSNLCILKQIHGIP